MAVPELLEVGGSGFAEGLHVQNWEMARKLGLFYDRPGGIQINVNTAFNSGGNQADFCDHECAKLGCPARISVNRGVLPRTMASSEKIVKAVEIGTAGLLLYVQGDFLSQLQQIGYPKDVVDGMIGVCQNGKIEVNVFGGNPELHPGVFEIVKALKELGHPVNLTTTGGRLFNQDFFEKMCLTPPDVLAMSLEQRSASELERLLNMSEIQLRKEWSAIDRSNGERRKAIEAIHGANQSLEDSRMPNVLFNWVIDGENMKEFSFMAQLIRQKYGTRARVNPYPLQKAPFNEAAPFGAKEIETFEQIVDLGIGWHLDDGMRKFIAPRLHTFLVWKAIYEAHRGDEATIAARLSGEDFWQCYKDPRAGRYLQIGKGETAKKFEFPGGMMSCFWKEDAFNNPNIQVWNSTAEVVRHHITDGMRELSQAAFNSPCKGCTMPRLVFDAASLVAGMADPQILDEYRKLQMKYVGF